MKANLLRDKKAYSTMFWTVFFTFCLIPIMALSIELGRYYIARTQIAAAADASALAAAIEINQNTFVQTGQIVPNSTTYSWAQKAASLNGEELISRKIYPSVSNIVVKNGSVMVAVSADLSILFPSVVPDIQVTELGKAEVRALSN